MSSYNRHPCPSPRTSPPLPSDSTIPSKHLIYLVAAFWISGASPEIVGSLTSPPALPPCISEHSALRHLNVSTMLPQLFTQQQFLESVKPHLDTVNLRVILHFILLRWLKWARTGSIVLSSSFWETNVSVFQCRNYYDFDHKSFPPPCKTSTGLLDHQF